MLRRRNNKGKTFNNIYNTGTPIFARNKTTNPTAVVEVNGNNINLQRLPEQISRNDIYGENIDVDTTERILAPNMPLGGVDITFPTSATTMQIASTSANDTSAGTGAQLVTIFGLDADYISVSETVTMNGQTPVTTTQVFLRIQESVVVQTGSTLGNEGNIYISDNADTFSGGEPQNRCYDSMAIGDGFSKTATFTVPLGQVLLQQTIDISTTATSTNRITCKLKATGEENNIEGEASYETIHIANNSSVNINNSRRRIPKQDIWLTIVATGGTPSVHAKLTTILNVVSFGSVNLLEG